MVSAGPWGDPSTPTSTVLTDLFLRKFVLDLAEKDDSKTHTNCALHLLYCTLFHCFCAEKLSAGSWSVQRCMFSTMNMRNLSLASR